VWARPSGAEGDDRQVALAGQSLRTERLSLTGPTRADVAAVYAITSDPRAVEHNPSDRLAGEAAAEALVARWMAHWEQFGFGYWCVRPADRSEVIGVCGLKVVTFRDTEWLNLLYRFAPTAWGRGYATEAATAVVAWADEHQPRRQLLARIRPGNVASQQVALRAGLRRAPALDENGEDGPDLLFTR
jgi:[ribosomal protein S5]-alanine N-acetyltransferase